SVPTAPGGGGVPARSAGGVRGSELLLSVGSRARSSPHPPRACGARHPLPQGERVLERVSRSSRDLPRGSAVFVVLYINAHHSQFRAYAIRFGEILGLTGVIA